MGGTAVCVVAPPARLATGARGGELGAQAEAFRRHDMRLCTCWGSSLQWNVAPAKRRHVVRRVLEPARPRQAVRSS
eukprot:187168-Prymnesium_polylepis.1